MSGGLALVLVLTHVAAYQLGKRLAEARHTMRAARLERRDGSP